MEDRGDRRSRTDRYVRRALRAWLSLGNNPVPLGPFAKGKANGCRCRRKRKGQPKIARGCKFGGFCYQPGTEERIAGKRLVKVWRSESEGWIDGVTMAMDTGAATTE